MVVRTGAVSFSQPFVLAALLLCASALTGCDLAPQYHVPLTATPVNFKEAATWQKAVPGDHIPRGSWWQMFGDPMLNDLEAQVGKANPTIAAALATFEQARALSAEADSGLFPTLSLGGQVNSDRQSNRRPTRGGGEANQYLYNQIDVQASYQVDLWDKVANSVRAGKAAAQASAADLETTRLSLHAELAADYAALCGFDAQARVLTNAENAYRRALDLTRRRFAGQIASEIDVSRAESQLDAAEAALTEVANQRASEEHAIAILVGKLPSELSIPTREWRLALPEITPGLPSTLLERRPDVASAERQMFAANATIGVTRAAFYPTLSLNLLYGFQDTGFGLLSLPNDLWAVGPGLALPLFEGGLRDAEEAAAIASYKVAVAHYRMTVLKAFQQVEDGLSQIRLLDRESQEMDAAVVAGQRTVNKSTNLYMDGTVTFLEVAVAQTEELRSEQASVDLRTRRMKAAIALVDALGGGWAVHDIPDIQNNAL